MHMFLFSHVTGSTYSGITFRATYISKICKKFEKNWKNSICIAVNNFANSINYKFLNFTGVFAKRKIEINRSLNTTPYAEKY